MSATIERVSSYVRMGWNTLTGHMSDGTEEVLFGYYIDELTFGSSELIGRTAEEARDLRHRRDVAYLRS